MKNRSFFLFAILILAACSSNNKVTNQPTSSFSEPPSWAKEAVWYQIFIERFRDGNTKNNPTIKTCTGALSDSIPNDWTITPWGHNWYQQEDWAKNTGLDFYRSIQMRRYGGDLDGVEEKIDYLKKLGINAIYFNPLNDAPSLHKFDARNYHHIDITLGDDIEGDINLMRNEKPNDAATWTWTTADKKFISLIKKLHSEGIRVVLDFSWNHTGKNFWAFKDLEKNLDKSPYKDWYECSFKKDEKTGETSLTYEGWIGISSLPELNKVNAQEKITGHPYEGDIHPDVKAHIFDVSKRWIDPNGDGIFDDGIDGMRLDVAEHVPLGFWRDFRKYVRSINPDFYLVGENWWTQWPDILMDPVPWVKGDIFDAVMHYQWYKVARGYFAQKDESVSLSSFKNSIDSVFLKYPEHTRQAMMNLSASHDAPRLLTCFANPSKYKYNAVPRDNPNYWTGKPSLDVLNKVKLFLLHQYTFVGSPHIWNGDEMGMTGADDPDCRKPLIWPDIDFEIETPFKESDFTYSEKQTMDDDLFDYYASLIRLRKSSKAFTSGRYQFLNLANNQNILCYKREEGIEKYVVIFNKNNKKQNIEIPSTIKIKKQVFNFGNVTSLEGKQLILPPYSAVVFLEN
ncbi:MAG: glycoside hydrolase family 13 protein [Saprospiraceae bacterium]